MKRFINRLPLLLLILTLVSLGLMILVRIAASGTKLLSTGSGVGRLIAGYYHPSVVVFIVILVLFIAVIFTVRLKQIHRRKQEIAENEAFTPGDLEYPPSTVMSMDQIEAAEEKSDDAETVVSEIVEDAETEIIDDTETVKPETPENVENQD